MSLSLYHSTPTQLSLKQKTLLFVGEANMRVWVGKFFLHLNNSAEENEFLAKDENEYVERKKNFPLGTDGKT